MGTHTQLPCKTNGKMNFKPLNGFPCSLLVSIQTATKGEFCATTFAFNERTMSRWRINESWGVSTLKAPSVRTWHGLHTFIHDTKMNERSRRQQEQHVTTQQPQVSSATVLRGFFCLCLATDSFTSASCGWVEYSHEQYILHSIVFLFQYFTVGAAYCACARVCV